MNTEKLVHQLFIGKVADILGFDKTTQLLKEAKDAIEPLNQGQKLPMAGVVKSCGSCHYSDNGNHGCNRLMKGVEPEIDITKGIDCAYNDYAHYLKSK